MRLANREGCSCVLFRPVVLAQMTLRPGIASYFSMSFVAAGRASAQVFPVFGRQWRWPDLQGGIRGLLVVAFGIDLDKHVQKMHVPLAAKRRRTRAGIAGEYSQIQSEQLPWMVGKDGCSSVVKVEIVVSPVLFDRLNG